MSKYEIEIEGLPEGFEPVKAKIDWQEEELCSARLTLRRKVRKYDWSKTLSDVLVKNGNGYLMRHGDCSHPTRWLSDLWQPNIHGKCPVDPEAIIVRIRKCGDAKVYDEGLAGSFNWSFLLMAGEVIASWQLIRLVDGVEW